MPPVSGGGQSGGLKETSLTSLETTMSSPLSSSVTPVFEVRFVPLFAFGRALCFPCDAGGHVDLDALPAKAKNNYFFARAMIGKDFLSPSICRAVAH
jgi:hypothetical protein